MKKIILFVICLITALANAQSPSFLWAKQLGGTDTDWGNSIAVDSFGNVYSTGSFEGTADFDPGTGTYYLTSSHNNSGIFISKLDGSGNFIWAKGIGDSASNSGRAITLDQAGNIFVAGYFYGTADFDPGTGTHYLTSNGREDIFILKLDTAGNFVWAKQMGGTGYDRGLSVTTDNFGNVYTTGTFSDTVDFDPGIGVFNLIAPGNSQTVFINKLDPAGNFMWAKQIPAEDGWGIKADSFNNIYITGMFGILNADFDPGPGTYYLSSVFWAVFVLKLNSSGNFMWAKQFSGGTTSFSDAGCFSIAIDGSGNILTTGQFRGTVDFDPGSGVFNMTSGYYDVFICKLNSMGNFVWAKQIGDSIHPNSGYSVTTDALDNVYATGRFQGNTDFDPGVGVFYMNTLSFYNYYILKYNSFGNFIWAKQINASANELTVDNSGNIYTIGNFGGTIDFDLGSGIYNMTSFAGSQDVYIHKMIQCTPPSAAITPAGPTAFCSGGSVILNAPTGNNKTYQWKKGGTLISGATLSSYTATTGGNYRVIVTNTVTGCSKTTGSAVVVTVNAKPAATITPQGPTTFCAGGSVVLTANTGAGLTFKWKKGSNFISGATLSNYTATTGGNYKVQVTNSNGCSKTSAGVVVSVPCREGEITALKNNLDFSVYPNPNSGEFTIKFSNRPTSLIQIELTDEIGKIVKRFETNDETVIINESNLTNGIYCLTARNKDAVIIKKISIVK